MEESILTSIKQMLGVPADYTVFDLEIVMHINAALADLSQQGIGPVDGFKIVDADSVWSDFMGEDPQLNQVQPFVYYSVRLAWDPPPNGYAIDSMTKMRDRALFYIGLRREELNWVDPDPSIEPDLILDGGGS